MLNLFQDTIVFDLPKLLVLTIWLYFPNHLLAYFFLLSSLFTFCKILAKPTVVGWLAGKNLSAVFGYPLS